MAKLAAPIQNGEWKMVYKMVRKALKLAPYEWSSDQEEYDWLIKNKVIRE